MCGRARRILFWRPLVIIPQGTGVCVGDTEPRGRPKTKSVTPVVGGWVRVRKRTRVRFIFFSIFFIVLLNSPHRETPKNVIKKKIEKKSVLDFWSNFL
jgi:hypothetical protein